MIIRLDYLQIPNGVSKHWLTVLIMPSFWLMHTAVLQAKNPHVCL